MRVGDMELIPCCDAPAIDAGVIPGLFEEWGYYIQCKTCKETEVLEIDEGREEYFLTIINRLQSNWNTKQIVKNYERHRKD